MNQVKGRVTIAADNHVTQRYVPPHTRRPVLENCSLSMWKGRASARPEGSRMNPCAIADMLPVPRNRSSEPASANRASTDVAHTVGIQRVCLGNAPLHPVPFDAATAG